MTHERAKRKAVRAIDRIVAAAKDLAEAEAMLLGGEREGKSAKTNSRRLKKAVGEPGDDH